MKRRFALKASSLAAIGLTASINGGCSKNTFRFNHGVASGDPSSDQVILWTRVTPEQPGPIKVILEVSSSSDFNNIAFTKSLKTSSLSDYTVKYDLSIQDIFQSGETFYYRFKAGTAISESGKTKTLALNINKVKIGVFSCSNFPAGFFNAYQAAAEKNDLDLWLHLGDYLYEYPMGGYATSNAKKLGRVPSPLHEIITLADYRERHAQYKLDHGSKALHRNAPMIAVWDDHEFSNDTWKKGAENHSIDGSEGDFYARRSAAIKAYHEWMPIREQQNKRKIFREFKIGKLIQLLMLDTRQYERDKQIQPKDYLSDSGFNQASFYSDLNSLDRKLLGKEQLAWIEEKMTAEDFKWTVMGQQVLMTKLKFPDLSKMLKKEDVPTFLKPYLKFLGLGIPSNLDAWDGYPAERNKFYRLMQKLNKNFISLAGDTHNSWVANLTNDEGTKVGIELGAPSVTSPGITDVLKIDKKRFVEEIVDINPELDWMDPSQRGYLSLDFSEDELIATFNFIKELEKIDPSISSAHGFKVQQDKLHINKINV
jgi:alkaline phosphatase D|tara:strand:+ start:150 stop:1766 length:1617 start_codon:yes stop_codon:yes gene_type:complete